MGCTSSAVSPPRPPPKRHQRLSTSFSSSDAGDETAASSPERVVIAVPSASPLQPSPRIQADISCASCGIVFDTEEELAFHERLHLPASAAASPTSRVCSGVRPNHPRPSPGNIFESFSDFVSLLDAPQTPVLRPNAGLSPALSAMFAPSNPPSQSNPAEYESDVQGRVIDGVSAGGRGRGDSYPPARSRVRGVRLASSLTSQSFSSSPSDDDIALMFGMRSPAVVSEPSGLSLPASPSPLPAVGISRAFGLHLPISESLSSTPRARVSGGQSAHLASPPAVPAPPSADSLCDRLWPSASVPSPLFELVPSSLPSPLPPPPPPPPSNTDGCIGRAGAPIVDRSLCPASVPLPALITDQSDVPEWGPGQEDTLDDWLSDEPGTLVVVYDHSPLISFYCFCFSPFSASLLVESYNTCSPVYLLGLISAGRAFPVMNWYVSGCIRSHLLSLRTGFFTYLNLPTLPVLCVILLLSVAVGWRRCSHFGTLLLRPSPARERRLGRHDFRAATRADPKPIDPQLE